MATNCLRMLLSLTGAAATSLRAALPWAAGDDVRATVGLVTVVCAPVLMVTLFLRTSVP